MKITKLLNKFMKGQSIQVPISISFTALTVVGLVFLGSSLYSLFGLRMQATATENSKQLLNQAAINLETYLRNMRLISDTMYYSVIKEEDLSETGLEDTMNLLYDANKDNLVSIACYRNDGQLLAATPVTTEKRGVDVTAQSWYSDALDEMENFHFSTPHVQNIFDSSSYRYYWVVSLSRAVEITNRGKTELGVLLIDMNYSSIEQTFDKINSDNSSGYTYLIDNSGHIIYHPKRNLIAAGLYNESNDKASTYSDGVHEERFMGEKRLVTVRTVSYTGWKIVNVLPEEEITINLTATRYLVILLVAVTLLILTILNRVLAGMITRPLEELTRSIEELDNENLKPDIYIGGSREVEYLGNTLRDLVKRLRKLMDDIVVEQEEKRKTELDALQSQINPHFLYNTLDSIVWMIEGERYQDAIFMITQLASLFRISISRGKNIIKVEDEIRHAKNYMNIQKIRYKNMFKVDFDIADEILNCQTVKLIIQPILENSLYYTVEPLDGDGEISIKGYREGKDIYIKVTDNGLGMTPETVANVLKENNRVRKRGSGVGLINVHNRIRLQFGDEYGLVIESELDEGTTVTIHLPFLEYKEEAGSKESEGRKNE